MPTPGPYDVTVTRDVRLAMRDGVTLSTDLYLPARNGRALGPASAVLVRTAYDRGNFANDCTYFASHGYTAVAQDVRGTFGSEGAFFAFVNEADDGVDTLNWLTTSEHCNGDVGMFGCSYMSWVQMALATQNPVGLKCLIPFGVGIDTFHHYAYPNGALQLGMIRWVIFDVWRRAARDNPELLATIDAIDFIRFAAELPWQRGQTVLAQSPQFEDIIFTYLEHRTYDAFWRQPGQAFDLYFEQFPDIPMLWVSGWWDGYPRSVCEGYRKLSERGRGERQHLLLGAWVHNQMSGNSAGDVDFGPDMDIDRLDTQRLFFDRHLRADASVDAGAKVRAFVMGGGSGRRTAEGRLHHGGRWWHSEQWPPPGMTITPYYLHEGGSLSRDAPTVHDAMTVYQHDPNDPVPSIAVPWIFANYPDRGPADQLEPTELIGNCTPGKPLAERADVRVFQTPPLESDVRLLGPLQARLYVQSSAPDTDFCVKLVDVYPPSEDYPQGYAMIVAEGIMRMTYREGGEQLVPMQAGAVYEIVIDCFPAANLFAAGHRIRIDIASSNFPRHEINRNTADPFSPEKIVATNTVFHDAARPSHVLLPIA